MQETRRIKVVTTRGKGVQTFELDYTTWGELRPFLSDEGYEVDTLRCVESVKRRELVAETSLLPTGDFNIFMYPAQKVSSGSRSWAELRNIVKNNDDLKSFLNSRTAKNWTQLTTSELNQFISEYETPGECENLSDVDYISVLHNTLKEMMEAGVTDAQQVVIDEIVGLVDTLSDPDALSENQDLLEEADEIFDELFN